MKEVIVTSPDTAWRQNCTARLTGAGWRTREASGAAEVLLLIEEHPAVAVLVDRWLPDLEVRSFASDLRRSFPELTVFEVTHPEAGSQTSATRRELARLFPSPPPLEEHVRATSEAASNGYGDRQPQVGTGPLRSGIGEQSAPAVPPVDPGQSPLEGHHFEVLEGIIGQSAPMRELARLIRLVATHDSRVLIEGETGSGKELVAEALHRLSRRSQRPLVTLNCAAIPESLLESELFGHAKGAFTGAASARVGRIEAADGGTLFLDEIGELSLPLQAKLLRFLENGELQRIGQNEPVKVNVRVIAATHRNLDANTEAGSFRLDLLHRLSVFPIEVPALRERKEDIPALAQHLVERHTDSKQLTEEAIAALLQHSWPGNVRELAHVLERACILAGDRTYILEQDIRVRKHQRSI